MASLEEIKHPIATELTNFHKKFRQAIKTDITLLDRVNRYILSKKGKQLRPILVFLSAKLCGEVSEKTYTAATLVELFHTATLLHDDVVDNAITRRGIFSINALWKSKIAILVGDFLLSRSMLIALENKDFKLLEVISTAVKEISEGELLQLDKSRKQNTSIDNYLTIIEKKTAALFAGCTQSGATSTTNNQEKQTALFNYGLNFGIAFQMQDDLLDFDKTNKLGKPLYNDLKERKMTLPLIYALQQSKERATILKLFKKKKKKFSDLQQIVNFIKENNGINYTAQKINEYKNLAIKHLDIFEDSPCKKALIDIANYSTQRKK